MAENIDIQSKQLRLFVAFPFPKNLWNEAEQVQKINADLRDIRWTPLQNFHITIFFLGAVAEQYLNEVQAHIKEQVSTVSPFQLSFEKVALQKGKKHSGMVWFKFYKNENFSALSHKLNEALDGYLIHPTVIHDPVPHITLARWKRGFEAERFNPASTKIQLPEITFCELWQSINTAEGVRYKSLQRFELNQ